MASKKTEFTPVERIVHSILMLRGQRILLDSELAQLYGVPTKRLNEQVKRNAKRFPADFVFRLTKDEVAVLNRSQFATGSQKHRNPRSLPFAFTEHGAIMAATVLNSPRAVEISIYVVRAFIQLRSILSSNRELAKKLQALERKFASHDQAITEVVKAIRQLMSPPVPSRRSIGFIPLEEKK